MKKMILILTLLSLLACSDDESKAEHEVSLFGTWQLVERFDGGSLKPNQSIENGYTIAFYQTGNVRTNHPTIGCPVDYAFLEGNYSQGTDGEFSTLSLVLDCDNDDLNINYYYSFDDQFLLLSLSESTCFEGCYDKFEKIAELEEGE